jgi:hypothetical protein
MLEWGIMAKEVKRELKFLDKFLTEKKDIVGREFTADELKFMEGMSWAYYRVFKMIEDYAK